MNSLIPSRRKLVQLMNGFLLAVANAKIVRAFPETFSYRKNRTESGMDCLSLANKLNDRKSEIFLRAATSDWFTFDQIFIGEDYNLRALKRYPEFETLYANYCAQGTPLIVDLGANIGLSGIYFHHVWPASQIVAIEPSEDNFSVLTKNFGGGGQLTAIHAGVASRPSRLALADPSVEKNAFTTTLLNQDDEEGIPGVTVTEILARFPRDKGYLPFIVKIDIEGFESELFSANTEWVDEFPVLIIEMHDWLFPGEGTSGNFLRTVAQLDRDFVYLGENVFSIRNERVAPSVQS